MLLVLANKIYYFILFLYILDLYLVTDSVGFLGSNVYRQPLESGENVRVIVLKNNFIWSY